MLHPHWKARSSQPFFSIMTMIPHKVRVLLEIQDHFWGYYCCIQHITLQGSYSFKAKWMKKDPACQIFDQLTHRLQTSLSLQIVNSKVWWLLQTTRELDELHEGEGVLWTWVCNPIHFPGQCEWIPWDLLQSKTCIDLAAHRHVQLELSLIDKNWKWPCRLKFF